MCHIEIKENSELKGKQIGDMVIVHMTVKGIEQRKDYHGGNLEDAKTAVEETFYKLKYDEESANTIREDDGGVSDDDLTSEIKGLINKVKNKDNGMGDELKPLPSKQTPYVGDSKEV